MEKDITCDMEEWRNTQFKLVLDARLLNRFLHVAGLPSDEFILTIDDGFRTKTVDDGNVFMTTAKIDKKHFEECNSPSIKMGINCKPILKLMRLTQSQGLARGTVTLFKESNSTLISLNLVYEDYSYGIDLKPIDTSRIRGIKVSNLSFKVIQALNENRTYSLKKFFWELRSGFGEKTYITAAGNELIFKIGIKEDDGKEEAFRCHIPLDVKQSKPIEGMYTTDYLSYMMQRVRYGDRFVIRFRNDYPIQFYWRLEDCIEATFTLAPRIEPDD